MMSDEMKEAGPETPVQDTTTEADKYQITAYKGFNKDMTCRDMKYEEGGEYESPEAKLCNTGFHVCELPHRVFSFYPPGKSVYRKVQLGGLDSNVDNDTKRCGKYIKIGEEINVWDIVQRSVSAFFDYFGFYKKLNFFSAQKAGYSSAQEAGHSSAQEAGDYSAQKAGYSSAQEAGDYSAQLAGKGSKSKAGKFSVVYGIGVGCKISGGLNSVLALAITNNDEEIIGVAHAVVDGENIKADTFYTLENGNFTEVCDEV